MSDMSNLCFDIVVAEILKNFELSELNALLVGCRNELERRLASDEK